MLRNHCLQYRGYEIRTLTGSFEIWSSMGCRDGETRWACSGKCNTLKIAQRRIDYFIAVNSGQLVLKLPLPVLGIDWNKDTLEEVIKQATTSL